MSAFQGYGFPKALAILPTTPPGLPGSSAACGHRARAKYHRNVRVSRTVSEGRATARKGMLPLGVVSRKELRVVNDCLCGKRWTPSPST